MNGYVFMRVWISVACVDVRGRVRKYVSKSNDWVCTHVSVDGVSRNVCTWQCVRQCICVGVRAKDVSIRECGNVRPSVCT